MKRIIVLLITTVLLVCCSTSIFASSIDLKEGMWQITTTMEIPGMPHKMPGTSFTQCLTQKDIMPPVNQDDHCQIQDQSISGNTVNYKMVCNQDGETTSGTGSFSYNNDTMTGRMEVDAGGMKIITSYSGTWVGPCR